MAVIDRPIEIEPLEPTVAEDIDRMILYIEEHGWCQSRYQDDQGRVCITGAIFCGPPPLSEPDSRQEKVISAIHQAVSYELPHILHAKANSLERHSGAHGSRGTRSPAASKRWPMSLVLVDVEATGISPYSGKMTEFGAVGVQEPCDTLAIASGK